ncbi:MAG: homocysteine biosynthesis protein [Firmicutes bacterium]|nr:homocysteine biosynthesis protein [Bacillota bacterium]
MARSIEEINSRIKRGKAVVLTKEEFLEVVDEEGVDSAARKVDVVTTATFGAMCSSGAFFNFKHTDPPMKLSRVTLNDVPAYGGLAAMDVFLGATEPSQTDPTYGGAFVIEALVKGEKVRLKATSQGTDCYPRKEIESWFHLSDLNQAYLFNPRNAYQNYGAASNGSDRVIHTYMGSLLPRYGNVTYSTSGKLSPLLNDPYYRTIGIGTKVFLAGAEGFVAWEGTQHNPGAPRTERGIPVGAAGTLALIGNLKEMDHRFLKAAFFHNYGVSLYVGIGVPIPVLDKDMALNLAVRDEDIVTKIFDYGVPELSRPVLGQVTYAQLRTGSVTINGKTVPTAPLSSIVKAREIASVLKDRILSGEFTLTEPVRSLPTIPEEKED